MNSGAAIFCVAETASGKIRGLINTGIRQFKGVPYGASTGGANRFRAPQKREPWAGIRECLAYGPVSPQVPTAVSNLYGQLIHFDLAGAAGGMSEDCLHLNVWTPALRDGGKRPVMVSFHGGGFAISSGNDSIYDGTALSRLGDVVVVTVTHRLSSFGFLDLADLGPEFRSAGVAGIMDLVLALEWVRDNIENFGGDPGRVMIFGQSGGGWKTSALLATPAAKGLFHLAAVQSGSLLRLQTREEASPLVDAFLAELGLNRTVSRSVLRDLPWQSLLTAQAKVGSGLFAPVLDGGYLPHHPFDPRAPEESANIPLIVSTTLDDASFLFDNFALDDEGLRKLLKSRHGDCANTILQLYRRKYPRKPAFLLQAQIATDSGFRRFAYVQADRKAEQGRAPVYMYRWDWATPAFEGRFGAAHATDAVASLHNVREAIVGAGAQPGKMLCDQLAAAWIAFARSGDPNNSLVPRWPAYTQNERSTMIFDSEVRAERDPDPELRKFWSEMPQATSIFG
jgi:para-nitrobenzyl esterase